jgi:hypothetical protein
MRTSEESADAPDHALDVGMVGNVSETLTEILDKVCKELDRVICVNVAITVTVKNRRLDSLLCGTLAHLPPPKNIPVKA